MIKTCFPEAPRALHFLGVDAASGETLREDFDSLPQPSAAFGVATRRLQARLAADDLSQAGWGIVLPRRAAPELIDALAPLIKRRREQAGDLFKQLTYYPREGPGSFLSRLRAGPGPVLPEAVPFYLLLVGSPAEIPHGFHFELGAQYAVGRISFPKIEDYAHYAHSVVAAEDRARRRSKALTLFSVGHEGDVATDVARRHLAEPLAKSLRKHIPELDLQHIDGASATKAKLKDCLLDEESPLLTSIGHAALFSAHNSRQRSCQGALVCAEWPGAGAANSTHYFSHVDVPAAADLTGRILWLFGCHTAGTPRLDSFGTPGQRDKRRPLTDEPFLARLPQALLSHPGGGALAVIAHVDRALPSHRFGDHLDGQVHCFGEVLEELLTGKRVGFAMQAFAQRHGELATRLVAQSLSAGDDDFDPMHQGELWASYCDTRSHIILGDPAAQIPVS